MKRGGGRGGSSTIVWDRSSSLPGLPEQRHKALISHMLPNRNNPPTTICPCMEPAHAHTTAASSTYTQLAPPKLLSYARWWPRT